MTTNSTGCVSADDVIDFSCSHLSTLAACDIEGRHVWLSEGSKAGISTAPYPFDRSRVEGTIGVRFDTPWKDRFLDRVPDDMPDGYLAAETCVLTNMTEARNRFDKDLSSFKKPCQPRRAGPSLTLRNVALTATSVEFILDLHAGDVAIILRPAIKAIMGSAICVPVASPVARVMGGPADRIYRSKRSQSEACCVGQRQ